MVRALSLLFAAFLGVMLLAIGVGQETPAGGIKGRLTMTENGLPLANAMVSIETLGPIDDLWRPRYDTTDEAGVYEFPRLPVGAYRLSVSTKAHHVLSKVVVVEEGKVAPQDLGADPSDPRLQLYASKRVFSPQDTPAVELHGFIMEDSVEVRVTRLSPEEVTRQGGLQQALGAWPNSEFEKPIDPAVGTPVSETVHKLRKRDAEGTFVEPLELPKLPEGVFWVHVASKEQTANAVISVSKIALVTKDGGDRILSYVTDLETGQPVPGAEVSQRDGEKVAPVGKTGKDGLVEFELGDTDRPAILARSGSSVAICDFYSGEGESVGDVRLYTYTDRPVYRPGDTVSFKGIVRRLSGTDYKLPGAGTATVEVLDPQENVVAKMTLPVSAHGTFHGTYTSSAEADPGSYQLHSKALGGEDERYFPLAAYRKPQFTVAVTPQRPWTIFGERGAVTVECKYFFGGPVVNAKVTATVYRSPKWSYYAGDSDEEYEEEEGYGEGGYTGGEYSQEVVATTDHEGRAVIAFDTRTQGDPQRPDTDYDYTVSVSVAESGDKYVSAEGTVPVVRAAFSLNVDTELYVASPGDRVPLTIGTTAHDEGHGPVPDRAVTVTVGKEEWQGGQSRFVPFETRTVRTGADGLAKLDVPVGRSDSMTIRAEAKDDQGRAVTSETYIYVEGDTASRNPQAGKLSLTLDRKQYAEGQSAKAVIQCDSPGGAALLTVEAEGILSRRVVPLDNAATTVRIPVSKGLVPNAYVSVAYVRKGAFLEASKRLVVDLGERKLQVAVESDRPDAKPGETVNLTVRTTEPGGRPVPAEISVGVVDESIYAIRKDSTDPLKGMYPKRSNEVSTVYSFAEVYLDGGDKSPADIPVRRRFMDTALWRPAVQTDRTGRATVRVRLPDNLTSGRATAVGVTDGTAVGVGRTNFRARKDLMVRLELPTFLVQGDTQRVVAIVNNDTGKDADVNVTLEPQGVGATGPLRARAGFCRAAAVRRMGSCPRPDPDRRCSARRHDRRRAERRSAADDPHLAQGPPGAPDGGGADQGERVVPHAPDRDRRPEFGGLTITLSRSIDGLSEESLEYRGLSVRLRRADDEPLPAFGALLQKRLQPVLAAKVPKIAADSFVRLANMQHEDGGWGWWENDESEAFMTAYVLDGLALAAQAGLPESRDRRPWGGSTGRGSGWWRRRRRTRLMTALGLTFALTQHRRHCGRSDARRSLRVPGRPGLRRHGLSDGAELGLTA